VRGFRPKPFKPKQMIKKQRSTIGKGRGGRLKWSHEDARALVASKFLR
jgi:hypothetical protein